MLLSLQAISYRLTLVSKVAKTGSNAAKREAVVLFPQGLIMLASLVSRYARSVLSKHKSSLVGVVLPVRPKRCSEVLRSISRDMSTKKRQGFSVQPMYAS